MRGPNRNWPMVGLTAAVLLLVAVNGPAWGQRSRRNSPNGPNMESLQGTGEIVAARQGLLQVKAEDGTPWLMQVKAEPKKIRVEGTAHPNLLTPGLFVRFSAALDRKGEAQAPVKELTIFTPRPEMSVGVVLEAALDRGAFQFGEEAKPPASDKAVQTYLVAGRITNRKNNQLVVTDGRSSVKFTLSESPDIQVDLLGDYRMIRPGDKVEYKGKYFQAGKAVVSELKVTGATPFGEPPPKPEPKSRQRKNSS